MQPHEEELPPPIIYERPFAVPLRLALALNLLTFSLYPGCGGALLALKKITRKRFILLGVMTITLFAASFLLPMSIIGERFYYLNMVVAFGGILLYLFGITGLYFLSKEAKRPSASA
jgi:hypothetical protein